MCCGIKVNKNTNKPNMAMATEPFIADIKAHIAKYARTSMYSFFFM